ncbi:MULTISPECIES: hypothetical protein [Olivibacter]|uniref:Uncharacterized protein n=1 Tax=Olivibacter jilunii TaxID=985016 RepID=A0ABW6B2Q9_9SPHI
MRNSRWSKTAVAAFLLTLGATAASKAVQQETIWVYQDGSNDTTSNPDCQLNPEEICALEYHTDASGQPDFSSPTGAEMQGQRNQ